MVCYVENGIYHSSVRIWIFCGLLRVNGKNRKQKVRKNRHKLPLNPKRLKHKSKQIHSMMDGKITTGELPLWLTFPSKQAGQSIVTAPNRAVSVNEARN